MLPRDRGDNPAVAAAEASPDVGAEAKRKSVRNPIELAKSKALRQHEKHEQGEFRRELGVVIYNFDKKEQVPSPCSKLFGTTSAQLAVDVGIALFRGLITT